MNTRVLLGLLAAAAFSSASHADDASHTRIGPDDRRIAYMGRVEMTSDKAVMGFPGIVIRFAYSGPAPSIRMSADSPNCYFNLSCNGWDPVVIRLDKGENRIVLPTGAAPEGGWLIELVRRTESWMGTASLDGLDLPAGCRLLSPPEWPKRKLMFIGDSLTCGEYDERFPNENDSTARSTNAARSYGMLLAKWLGTQVHLVSYGGRGITRDWSGRTNVNTVPVFYGRTLPDSDGLPWDPGRFVPDVIVINDGTDFDGGPLDAAKFTEAYAAFVARVRSDYPDAFILLTESGFQSDGSDGRPTIAREQLLKTISQIVGDRRKAGDRRVGIARSGFFPGTPSNSHVVAFQQEQIALQLMGPIRAAAGW